MANDTSTYTPEPTDFKILPLDDTLDLPVISLSGFMLPLRGVSFKTEQRIKTTYYPGNPQAGQTVVGPTYPNTVIGGRWMDISRNVSDGEPRTIVRQIEYLAEHAVPVLVHWGGRSFGANSSQPDDPAVTRRGLIKYIDPKYNRLEDIEWTIEFEWSGKDVQSQSPTLSSDIIDQGGAFVDFSDMLTETQDVTTSWTETAWGLISDGATMAPSSQPPQNAPTAARPFAHASTMRSQTPRTRLAMLAATSMLAVSDALDYMQNRIVDAITVVDGASDLLQSAGELPANIASRVRGVCDRMVLACANGRAAVGAFCGGWELGAMVARSPTPGSTNNTLAVEAGRAKLAMIPTDDPLDHLDRETALYDVISQWDDCAALAAQRSAALQAQTLPDIIGIERPPAGSDLRDLAVKYWGDSTLWVVIAAFPANNLSSSEVPATPTGPSDTGAPPIYIPRLTSASTALAQLWGPES